MLLTCADTDYRARCYIDSLSATLRICTPCTREAPLRIAAATWTASVISSELEPCSSAASV